jgi:multiple sugar transport system ATP-binding protein
MREFKPWHHIPGIGAWQLRRSERRPETVAKVEAVAKSLGIEKLLDRRPRTLSGGQRQRVAVGRAMVRSPKVFLMDEPLSNLDANLRVQMRTELSRLHRELNSTFVYVTHDQTEALSLGTSVLVLNHGKLQQFGPPKEIFGSPANVFVARFIGSPPMNLLRVTARDGQALKVADAVVGMPVPEQEKLARLDVPAGDLLIGVRPNELRIVAPGTPGSLAAKVEGVENTGIDAVVALRLADDRVQWRDTGSGAGDGGQIETVYARVPLSQDLRPDQNVGCEIHVESLALFRASTGERVRTP